MKLLSKTNRYYFIYTAILLTVGGIAFFFIINNIIKEEVEEVLEHELGEFIAKAESDSTWLNFEKPIEFEIRKTTVHPKTDIIKDTLIVERDGSDYLPYLQMKVYRKLWNNNYEIILRESLIETEGILFGVVISMIILFIAILIGLLLMNNYLSSKLWKPFYGNLAKVKTFNLSELNSIDEINSDIYEFQELNKSLIKMTDRIKSDYNNLKEFTENASHEIQTPLAIIRSNIDWLLQKVTDENQLKDLMKIELATNRIAKTNQALLLLTKIENRHFTHLESHSVEKIIDQRLVDYEDFIADKNIKVEKLVVEPIEVRLLNKTLIDILINNLISNAVKHNHINGYVKITLSNENITVENSGEQIEIDPNRFFNRFTKANPSTESAGLGLSIIKQICDSLGYKISYSHHQAVHKVKVCF